MTAANVSIRRRKASMSLRGDLERLARRVHLQVPDPPAQGKEQFHTQMLLDEWNAGLLRQITDLICGVDARRANLPPPRRREPEEPPAEQPVESNEELYASPPPL